jgi:hypothetical protein
VPQDEDVRRELMLEPSTGTSTWHVHEYGHAKVPTLGAAPGIAARALADPGELG